MIPKELIRKIKKIQIKTDRLVNDVLAGEYHSSFKGRGMEFDEVREYQQGDDVRTIDWKVTARTGRPHIKKFVEERELTVFLLVDVSQSGYFGSSEKVKREYAAEMCAVLAFSAIKNNDKVGLILFSDRIERYIPPKKGKRHVLRVIREILFFKPEGKGTCLSGAFEFLNSVAKRKSVAFFVSDFIDEGFERQMNVSGRRHDLIAVRIRDPREVELPDVGIAKFEDGETGAYEFIDTSSAEVRENYRNVMLKRDEELKRMFGRIDVDCIDVRTDRSFLNPVIHFFRRRERLR